MKEILVLKLNGWPDTFDERVEAITSTVDELVVIRPKPAKNADHLKELDDVVVYNLLPKRKSFVKPAWLKPIIFSFHVIQAILLMIFLFLKGRLPPVLHAFDYALGGIAGAIASHLLSVPLVVSVRGLKEPRYKAFATQEQTLQALINYNILRILTEFVLTNADHIVTKAPYQVDFVRDTFSVNPGFTTVPTGVDFADFNSSKYNKEVSEVINIRNNSITSDDKVILYLAKLVPVKGPGKILEHISTLDGKIPSNMKFVFVGEFRGMAFKRRFRELQNDVTDRVLLHSHRVPFEDVPNLINAADAVVLLSEPEIEGVPRVLQESCAMQTPIIASEVTGITDAFSDLPGCYLVDRNDPQQFAQAVAQAVTDPPEMPRHIFRKRFDIYNNYEKYSKIYTELAQTDH